MDGQSTSALVKSHPLYCIAVKCKLDSNFVAFSPDRASGYFTQKGESLNPWGLLGSSLPQQAQAITQSILGDRYESWLADLTRQGYHPFQPRIDWEALTASQVTTTSELF